VPFPEDVRNTLRQAGVNTASLDRIRLARGVVGKASYVVGAAIIGLGSIGLALALHEPFYALIVGLLIPVIFAVYFSGALWFAHRHPGVALLEGAELIQWQQMEMAAKDMTQLQGSQDQIAIGKE
jgi:hypothetical protein